MFLEPEQKNGGRVEDIQDDTQPNKLLTASVRSTFITVWFSENTKHVVPNAESPNSLVTCEEHGSTIITVLPLPLNT